MQRTTEAQLKELHKSLKMDECFTMVKEEYGADLDYETPIGKIQQQNNHNDYLLTSEFTENKAALDIVSDDVALKKRKLKKIAFGDKKKRLAKIIKEYPFLWDKNHKFYRSRQKREAAWWKIADTLDITALEVKVLWKKLKDTHRYLSSKAKRKTEFNPNDFCDDNDDEYDAVDDLNFLDDNFSNCFGETSSLIKDSTFQANVSLPDPLNVDDSNCDDNPDTCYTYMDAKRPKMLKRTMDVPTYVGQITSSNFEIKREERTDSNIFKHMHIWMQLEKLFEKLDDDKITDLNFLFVSETYKAILDKRKNQ